MSNIKKIYIINGDNISDKIEEIPTGVDFILLPHDLFKSQIEKESFIKIINMLAEDMINGPTVKQPSIKTPTSNGHKIISDLKTGDKIFDYYGNPITITNVIPDSLNSDANTCDECSCNEPNVHSINTGLEYMDGTALPLYGLEEYKEYKGDKKWMKKLIKKSIKEEIGKRYKKIDSKLDNILTQIYGIDDSICDNHSDNNDSLGHINRMLDYISGINKECDTSSQTVFTEKTSTKSIDEVDKEIGDMKIKISSLNDTVNKLLSIIASLMPDKSDLDKHFNDDRGKKLKEYKK